MALAPCLGRLRDGVTREQAESGLQPFYQSIIQREVGDASFANASPDRRRDTSRPGSSSCRPRTVIRGCAGM